MVFQGLRAEAKNPPDHQQGPQKNLVSALVNRSRRLPIKSRWVKAKKSLSSEEGHHRGWSSQGRGLKQSVDSHQNVIRSGGSASSAVEGMMVWRCGFYCGKFWYRSSLCWTVFGCSGELAAQWMLTL